VLDTVPKLRDLDGDSVLYHYLEKELRQRDVFMFQMLVARLVTDLAIWFDPSVYDRLPILLPHVIRDEQARKRVAGVEMWASPTAEGLLRDDNSLVKESVKSLEIRAPKARSFYAGRRLGRGGGWVAAHVWQLRSDGLRASRHPATNTFVPNLVWLPTSVAKLTDRPGSFVQRFTQAVSVSIYRDRPVTPALKPFVADAWESLDLPTAAEVPPQALPSVEALNFFTPGEPWLAARVAAAGRVAEALEAAAVSAPPLLGRPRRYFEQVAHLDPVNTAPLRQRLKAYVDAIAIMEPHA
jgi:hypothetical protein